MISSSSPFQDNKIPLDTGPVREHLGVAQNKTRHVTAPLSINVQERNILVVVCHYYWGLEFVRYTQVCEVVLPYSRNLSDNHLPSSE